MIFGFNTDVPGVNGVYHVQTEDRGAKNPVVESVVYVGGKIMGRHRTSYSPAEATPERIEELVRRQHKDLVEAIRSGVWVPAGADGRTPAAKPQGYRIELLNQDAVRHGEYLRFQLCVKDRAEDKPAAAVALEVRWLLGGTLAEKQTLMSQADGGAEIWFPTPGDRRYATLLIRAQGPEGREIAKFHVRGFSQKG